jgi:endonuclease/exonuclease/phosphatase family metal-dependent hydrolase
MKLVNLNIGIKINNSKAVAGFLNKEKADIVVLQEVMRHFDKNVLKMYQSEKDIELLAGKPYKYKFFGPFFIGEGHGKNGKLTRDFGGMVEQGNEIMSRFPITNAMNHHYYKEYSYYTDFTNWGTEDHPRSLLIAELNINGKNLQILTLHGLWTKDKLGNKFTMPQVEFVIKNALKKNLPTIICGDFNLLPETKEIKKMGKKFRDLIKEFNITSTIPECKDYEEHRENKGKVYDYIFVNDKIKVKSFKVVDTTVSDHMPLILEFDIS